MLAAVNMRRVFASNWNNRILALKMLMKMVAAFLCENKNRVSRKLAFTIYQKSTKVV